jgi:2-iminobutanoate/2-iminopropanoate deaminase
MGSEQSVPVEFYHPHSALRVPFSEAVRVGNMLYLSGQIGMDPSGQVVPGGIAAETRQAMDNIRATLEKFGSSLDHVVKATVMLADMGEWAEMNQVYVTYFDQHLPARSAFGCTGLALGARVEIECIAVLD